MLRVQGIQDTIDVSFNDYDRLVIDYMIKVFDWHVASEKSFKRLLSMYHNIMTVEEELYEQHLRHRFK